MRSPFRNNGGWLAFVRMVNRRQEAGMITGFADLMRIMVEERKRVLEEAPETAPRYRIDERGAVIVDRLGRGPAHPLERV